MGQKAVFLSALVARAWQAHKTHDVNVDDINRIYVAQRGSFRARRCQPALNLLTARQVRGKVTAT
jgi:hypothetical protein